MERSYGGMIMGYAEGNTQGYTREDLAIDMAEYTFRLHGDFDYEELRCHLLYNGYDTVVSGEVLYVPEHEYYEVMTILDDRNIKYVVY